MKKIVALGLAVLLVVGDGTTLVKAYANETKQLKTLEEVRQNIIEVRTIDELKEAINNASDHDLIKIYPGEYTAENLEIDNKANINIQGCDENGQVLNDLTYAPEINANLIIRNQQGLKLSGLKIKNLHLSSSLKITIDNSKILKDISTNGISDEIVIENTTVSNRVSCSIKNSTFRNFRGTIDLGDSENILIEDSYINIYVGGSMKDDISKNTNIRNSEIYTLKIAYTSSAYDTKISNCNILSESIIGNYEGYAKNTTIENSNIKNNIYIGIKGRAENTVIKNNDISGEVSVASYDLGKAINTQLIENDYKKSRFGNEQGIKIGTYGGIAENTTLVHTEGNLRLDGGIKVEAAKNTLIVGDSLNYSTNSNSLKFVYLEELKIPSNILKGIGYKGAKIQVKHNNNILLNETLNSDGEFSLHLNSIISSGDEIKVNMLDENDNIINSAKLNANYEVIPISSKEDLKNIKNDLAAKYCLTQDIVFTEDDFVEGGLFYNNGDGWEPLGDTSQPFKGSFDGKGYKIQGLKVANTEYAGLFKVNEGIIKNLGIVDSNINNIKANRENEIYVGGIVAYNKGTIENCYNGSNISCESKNGISEYIGGIAGNNFGGKIYNSYNEGKISSNSSVDKTYLGGIAGDNKGVVSGCYNLGTIDAKEITSLSSVRIYVGGIVGENYSYGYVTKSYNKGNIKGHCESENFSEVNVAGIAGSNMASVSNSYNIGNIESYSKGIITSSSYAGGIVGYNRTSVSNCYTLGSLKNNGKSIPDRIIGQSEMGSSSKLENCYCVTDSLGIDEFLKQETYQGFDFNSIWTMEGNNDYLYPELRGVNMVFTKEFKDIEITNLPYKLTYKEGEKFDSTGLVVISKYNNGSKEEIKDYEISGYDSSVGKKTITIKYNGKTASFEVTVNPKMSVINSIPKIIAENVSLKEGDQFNPLEGVSAYDEEDGDLTDSIEVVSNDVDIYNQGYYEVIYKVVDSQGASAKKSISVNVRSNRKPEIYNVFDQTIDYGSIFDPMKYVSATDNEDGELTDKIVVEGNVYTTKPGKYKLVYRVTDSDGNTTEKEAIITVNEAPNNLPTISANDRSIDFGEYFDPLEGVSAYDEDEGDVTHKIEVISNNVNNKRAGTYLVEYKVVDKSGGSTIKSIYVTVKEPLFGWQQKDGKWYFYNNEGMKHKGWLALSGSWYYLDQNGIMQTGWLDLNGTWYYLYPGGSMATGWLDLNGTWYYLYPGGSMATGWLDLGGTWYYLYPGGSMATGWLDLDGTWYYFYQGGSMATGWLNLSGTWYYLYPGGSMATGWLDLGGTWYYLYPGGSMATGWLDLNGTWYYLYSSGAMAKNTTIDGWKIESNGVAKPSGN